MRQANNGRGPQDESIRYWAREQIHFAQRAAITVRRVFYIRGASIVAKFHFFDRQPRRIHDTKHKPKYGRSEIHILHYLRTKLSLANRARLRFSDIRRYVLLATAQCAVKIRFCRSDYSRYACTISKIR